MLFYFLCHNHIGLLRSTFTLSARQFGLTFGRIGFFECFGLCHLFGSHGTSTGFGLLFAAFGIGVGNFNLCVVFTRNGLGVGFGGADTRFLLRFGTSDFTDFVLFGHAHLGLVDGLGSSFFTKCFDVAALVLDVGNVDVDEFETNLFELDLHVGHDVFLKLVAVAVQFFDAH